jgi:hypothetical protein
VDAGARAGPRQSAPDGDANPSVRAGEELRRASVSSMSDDAIRPAYRDGSVD